MKKNLAHTFKYRIVPHIIYIVILLFMIVMLSNIAYSGAQKNISKLETFYGKNQQLLVSADQLEQFNLANKKILQQVSVESKADHKSNESSLISDYLGAEFLTAYDVMLQYSDGIIDQSKLKSDDAKYLLLKKLIETSKVYDFMKPMAEQIDIKVKESKTDFNSEDLAYINNYVLSYAETNNSFHSNKVNFEWNYALKYGVTSMSYLLFNREEAEMANIENGLSLINRIDMRISQNNLILVMRDHQEQEQEQWAKFQNMTKEEKEFLQTF